MHVLKAVHLVVGVLGIVAFVLTGQYMAIFLRGLADMPDAPRLLYRSSHIYLMWASLLNLIVGCYFSVAATRGGRAMQVISSTLLLAAPALMLNSFFLESRAGGIDRMLSGFGNYFALAGAILHAATSLKHKKYHAEAQRR